LPTRECISCNLLWICWSQLSCQRFKIYLIIKGLKSVYGIEQSESVEIIRDPLKNSAKYTLIRLLISAKQVWRYQRGNQKLYIEERQTHFEMQLKVLLRLRFINSLSLKLTDHRTYNNSNTAGVPTWTVYTYGAPDFTSSFKWDFCCSFCTSYLSTIICLFVIFLLTILLSVLLRFTASDC
jgi:hypothetical protein